MESHIYIEQLAMRVRFLAASDPTFVDKATVTSEKSALNIREEGITEEQATKRELADQELTCYVSLGMLSLPSLSPSLLFSPSLPLPLSSLSPSLSLPLFPFSLSLLLFSFFAFFFWQI
jgi:hypothetical protein